MIEALTFGSFNVPKSNLPLLLNCFSVLENGNAVLVNDGDLALFKLIVVACIPKYCGYVGGDEVFTVSDSDDKRRILSYGINVFGIAFKDYSESV